MSKRVLIMDGDIEFIEFIKPYLASDNFEVEIAYDGEAGIKRALNQPFSAIILELELPKINGFEALKAIRGQDKDTPILLLTGQNKALDSIVGLELGADDFVSKPCNPQEVIARLRAILRRAQRIPSPRPILNYGDITLDTAKREVNIQENILELTKAEFNILEILMKSPGQVFSKEELTEYALGRKFTAYDRSIDVHISNLRNKLGKNKAGEDWIRTVRGVGYCLAEKA